MKHGLKETRVEMGIFDYSVIFVIGDWKKLKKYINWKFEENTFFLPDIEPAGICCHKYGYVPVIWLPKKPKTAKEIATLSHECLHAVFHLFDWAKIQINRDTEEVVTHSMAHLIKEFLTYSKI